MYILFLKKQYDNVGMIDEEIFKNKEVLKKFSEHYMDMDIHNSTALEGNTLTRAEYFEALEQNRFYEFAKEIMEANYQECMKETHNFV